MHYLGLDIGGTKIAAVVMDAHGWEIRLTRQYLATHWPD